MGTIESMTSKSLKKDLHRDVVEHEVFYKHNRMLDVSLETVMFNKDEDETGRSYIAVVKNRWDEGVIWNGKIRNVEHFLNLLCMLDQEELPVKLSDTMNVFDLNKSPILGDSMFSRPEYIEAQEKLTNELRNIVNGIEKKLIKEPNK